MKKLLKDCDALLITNPINIYYLTGFTGLAPQEREGYCLVTRNILFLFTNALYIEKAQELTKTNPNLQIIELTREYSLSVAIGDLARKKDLHKLGFEEENMTVEEFSVLKEKLVELNFIPTHKQVEYLRQFKKTNELISIKKAAELTDKCFSFIQTKLVPGVSEAEIAWKIEGYFKKNGADNAFPPIVAFGPHSSQPHYESSANFNLKSQDVVLLDFAARVNGYCADLTRVIFVGSPQPEITKAYSVLLKAQDEAIMFLQKGERSGAALDNLVRRRLEEAGYPSYPHSLGHCLGLAIHELPRLSFRQDAQLASGMVFTVEPGIYIQGKFGLRIEDLVTITEKGVTILSNSSKEIVILNA